MTGLSCSRCGRKLEYDELKSHDCGRFKFVKGLFMEEKWTTSTVAASLATYQVLESLPWYIQISGLIGALMAFNDAIPQLVRRYVYR